MVSIILRRVAFAPLAALIAFVGCSHGGRDGRCCSQNLPGVTANNTAASRLVQREEEMHYQLAEGHWRRNDAAACQPMLEKLITRNPGHRQGNLLLAELHLARNRPRQALALMQRFCRDHRDDAEAHHLLGLAYEALGQTDRALVAYEKAAALDPDDTLPRKSLEKALAAVERASVPGTEASGHAGKHVSRMPSSTAVARSGEPTPLDDERLAQQVQITAIPESSQPATTNGSEPLLLMEAVDATHRVGVNPDVSADERPPARAPRAAGVEPSLLPDRARDENVPPALDTSPHPAADSLPSLHGKTLEEVTVGKKVTRPAVPAEAKPARAVAASAVSSAVAATTPAKPIQAAYQLEEEDGGSEPAIQQTALQTGGGK